MNFKNILTKFLEFARKVCLSFFHSIIHPREFFLGSKYDHFKLNWKEYLYTCLFMYLVFFGALQNEGDFSSFFKSAEYYTVSGNIFQLLFFTIPLFIWCICLIWLGSYSFKQQSRNQYFFIAATVFSNILLWEAFFYLLYSFIDKMVFVINYRYNKSNEKLSFDYLYTIIFYIIKYGQLLLPFFYFGIIMLYAKWARKWSIVFLLIISFFSSEIVYSFYSNESMLIRSPEELEIKKELQFLDKVTLYDDTWNLNYRLIAEDTAEVYMDFILKNNSANTYYGRPKFSLQPDEQTLKAYDTSVTLQKEKLFFDKYKFDYLEIDAASISSGFFVRPKSFYSVHMSKKINYNMENAIVLQEITSPNHRSYFHFNMDGEIYNLNDTRKRFSFKDIMILNFTEDRASLNLYPKAVQIYIAADSVLGGRRLEKQFHTNGVRVE